MQNPSDLSHVIETNATTSNTHQSMPSADTHTEETQGFTVVTAPITGTVRESSVFRVIQDLDRENHESKEGSEFSNLLTQFQLRFLPKAEAYLIYMGATEDTPEENPFSAMGFEPEKEAGHLRWDKKFANDNTAKAKQGYTVGHWTRRYRNSLTSELIELHVYIGQNGTVTSYQGTQYREDTGVEPPILTEVKGPTLSPELKKIIDKNVEPALALADKLFRERDARYMAACETAEKMNEQLESIMQKILTTHTQEKNHCLTLLGQYEALAKLYSEETRKINRYDDQNTDRRDRHVQQFFAYAKSLITKRDDKESEHRNQPHATPDSTSDTGSTGTELTLASRAQEQKLEKEKGLQEQERLALISEVTALIASLTMILDQVRDLGNTPSLLASSQTTRLALQSKLGDLVSFPELTKDESVLLSRSAKLIDATKQLNILDTLKAAVQLGDIDTVIQLYPHVQNKVLGPIFSELLVKIINSQGEELRKLIVIAQYFHQNSSYYRASIKRHNNHVLLLMGDIAHSFLFQAFIKHNYLAFELMLEQGFNPNGIGLAVNGVSTSITSAIIFLMGTPISGAQYHDFRYLDALFEAGAIVDFKPPSYKTLDELRSSQTPTERAKIDSNLRSAVRVTKKKTGVHFKLQGGLPSEKEDAEIEAISERLEDALDSDNPALRVEATIEMLKQNNPNANDDKIMKALENTIDTARLEILLKQNSALELLCFINQCPDAQLLEYLVPRSNLLSLLRSFSILVNTSDVNSRILPADLHKTTICRNVEEANALTRGSKAGPRVSLMWYHTNPATEKAWYQSVNFLLAGLYERFNETPPGRLLAVEEGLIKLAGLTEDTLEKTNLYYAALYLQLFSFDPEDPDLQSVFTNTQKIVKTFNHLGQAFFYPGFLGDPISKIRARNHFSMASVCCIKSRCSEQLQTTPLFKFAEKQLAKLPKPPVPPGYYESTGVKGNTTAAPELTTAGETALVRMADAGNGQLTATGETAVSHIGGAHLTVAGEPLVLRLGNVERKIRKEAASEPKPSPCTASEIATLLSMREKQIASATLAKKKSTQPLATATSSIPNQTPVNVVCDGGHSSSSSSSSSPSFSASPCSPQASAAGSAAGSNPRQTQGKKKW